MISKRAWEIYPFNYRQREVATLANWIRAGESGSIIGLAGAGKSNLLGFLGHRPEVMASYLGEHSFKLALIQVDLNSLPVDDLATFYRLILRSLFEAMAQLASLEETLPATVEWLYRKVEDKTDPFLCQSALREALLVFKEKRIRLTLIFDPFDRFCQEAPLPVLDNLRSLRDAFKSHLSYLIGLRREVGYLRDPLELGELYEIMDTHLCWLGPMEQPDARWVIGQVETATGQSFTEPQLERLIELTGGYPALLRAASHRLAEVSPQPEIAGWEDQLLAERAVQSRLADLCLGLTGAEEAALSALQLAWALPSAKDRRDSLRQVEQKHPIALARLQVKHLCRPSTDGWCFFSPLFARFVASLDRTSTGRIWREAKTDRFFQGETELTALSDRDSRLLRHFLNNPVRIHTLDDLIEAAWSEDESSGVSNESVQQAIRHLRKQIELNPAKPGYLVTEHRGGYRFFPEGAPRG